MRHGTLGVFNHGLCFKHLLVLFVEARQDLVLLGVRLDLQLLHLEVVLGELALDLGLLANKEDFFPVALDPNLVARILHSLLNVELVDLDEAGEDPLLRALQVQTLVQLHLVQQVVDVFRRKVELVGVPLAVDAVLVVVQLVPSLHVQRNGEHLEANGALHVPHAVVVLIGRVVSVHLLQAVTARELLNFFLGHAVAAHGLHAGLAHVHFITDPKARAAALVVHIGRLVGGQLIHHTHLSLSVSQYIFLNKF